ncbi:hypothetical protein F4818DRAFT_400548 [Hypoxylon cercidicola]|nr:hypothetical protein F4818DRAFT_400548 [Hypoxylon cercidicola]
MPPSLPVPSKAAIHALRGIALGTSCAIGAIVEDRRRRISTLKTAISNKEKLKSAKQYHGTANPVALHLDEAILAGDEVHWYQWDERSRTSGDYPMVKRVQRRNSTHYASRGARGTIPLEPEDMSESSSSSTTAGAQLSSPQHTQRTAVPSPNGLFRPPTFPQTRTDSAVTNALESLQTGKTTIAKQRSRKAGPLADIVTRILTSKDEERLDRALKKFFELSQTHCSLKQFDDEWIALSAQLSKECQEKGRWEDASKVLSTTASAGPLDEHQFYAHEPIPIIEFWLRQVDENGRCPPEAITTASRLFLTTFKEKPHMKNADLERIGRKLFALNILLDRSSLSVAHKIYWRVVGLFENPVEFIGWAIQGLYRYEDYKNVVKYFLLNFSKMSPDPECYNKTVDCVISAVEDMKGWKASQTLRALERMKRPLTGLLRSRWLMRLLQAHWSHSQDFLGVVALFDEISSMGLLDKVSHPMGIYRVMVELSLKAGEDDRARSYYNVLIQKYPDMSGDVALKGYIALALAKAGDWDSVFDAFTEMRALRLGQEKEYGNTFIMVLKVFAETHPASEVRDFVSKYTNVLGVHMHRYMVTIVANKYGECHDVSGFMSWIMYCCRAGFALDSSLVNAVLHNCSTKWELSYPELQQVFLKIQELDPNLINDVTHRIMSRSALTAGRGRPSHGPLSRTIAVNKLAYVGRTTNRRDVYEAMNQVMHIGRPATVISIYKRALNFGMPFCRYCLRLAVLAALKNPNSGSNTAIALIHTAYEQGDDVSLAVSAFIRFQFNNIQASADEALLLMRNLIAQFEAMHIIIDTAVLTQMAIVCTRVGYFDRAIALCNLAAQRGGHANVCFSRQSIKAMLLAYSAQSDLEGMKKLIDDILVSKYSADRSVMLYLKSNRRTVQKYHPSATRDALLDTIEYGLETVGTGRAKDREDGKMISQETLRIMQEAIDAQYQDSGEDELFRNWTVV